MANETTDNYTIFYIAAETLIGISAFFGNIMVILAVKLNPGLQNTTFYFIVSLALADLAVGILVVPLAIIVTLNMELHFHACLFMSCLIIILTNASILSLLAIAIDRYLRIKIPTRYRIVMTSRVIYISIFSVWIVSFLMGIVPMFGWNNRSNLPKEDQDTLNCTFTSVMSMNYMVYFNTFLWVFLPLLIMLGLYIEIFYLIRKQMKLQAFSSTGRSSFYGKEYKTAKSLALVLLFFALSWLPLSILNCVSFFNPTVNDLDVFQLSLFLAILLSHANSIMNPIIYAFKIQKLKDAYIRIIKSCFLQTTVLSDSASNEQTLDEISQE
ncbi:adenosine receptor A3 [Bombina bombina]|uniref:adenosine receptor A3 n=1 Tax=Bombina bombina TaxID=8345 RepID=UPI00235A6D6B|nr:adenosine receptor A3 [Bombina bombina]